MNPSNALK